MASPRGRGQASEVRRRPTLSPMRRQGWGTQVVAGKNSVRAERTSRHSARSCYGITRSRSNAGAGQPERSRRSGGEPRKDVEAGHPRHRKPIRTGEDAGGHRTRRPSSLAEKEERKRRKKRGMDAQG